MLRRDVDERPDKLAYQWRLDGTPIAGQSTQTHVIAASDAGHQLSCKVTAGNAGGTASAVSSRGYAHYRAGTARHAQPDCGTVRAGSALLFLAGGGGRVARYDYRFSSGANATCNASRPVLSAVFNRATSGTVKLTETALAGGTVSTTAAYTVLASNTKGADAASLVHIAAGRLRLLGDRADRAPELGAVS